MKNTRFKSRNRRLTKTEKTIDRLTSIVGTTVSPFVLWLVSELAARSLFDEPMFPIFR